MSRSTTRNQKAKLAADYNDLLKELSSHEMTSVGLYSIGETIGEGTFGKVKLGTHKLTSQKVAIKKISKQHAPMVAREIHLHRQLKHPNIVTLYEIIITESNIHVISEYCPHGELFEALTDQGRFSEAVAARWFAQLADAIRYCHSQDIIHRDLKLENILLDRDDNAKLCDFGFARQAQSRQMLETFCGSLAYSAPEVILRQKYTGPETDIWSLGVILYTLLAGELPFDDDSEIVTQRKIVKGDYSMPTYFSKEAADLITRMLKLNPSERVTIDQVVGHPWLRMTHEDDSDNEWTSTPSRNSSHSDIDSIFSAKVNTPDMEDDMTEVSSYTSCIDRSERRLSPLETAKFSPQVRHSLGMMSHELRRHARPPRFSAPTVSNRTLLSPPSYRSSLPSVLPSYNRNDETPMTAKEQQLANALVAAGIDEVAVREMRNGTCDALNGLWNILLERPEKRVSEGFISAIQQKSAQIPIQLPAKYTKKSVGTQTVDQGVDAMTQTYSGSDHSTEKGWLSSVKSWFGTKSEPEPRRRRPSQSYRNVDAPLRGDQPRRYWDNNSNDQKSTPMYCATSNQKHRRRVLQLSDPPVNELDQLQYSSTTASRRTYHPIAKSSLDSNKSDLMRPPVAATAPVVTNTLSIVTTKAIPSQAKEVDICEKRYSMMMYRPSFAAEQHSAATNDTLISMPPMAASAAPILPLCTPPQQQCEQSSIDTPASPVFSTLSPSSSDEFSSDEEEDPTSPALSLPTPQLDKRPTTTLDTRPSSSFNLPDRADFTPRSRLSVYGMNSNPSSRFAAKAIIEEEEEEEEEE